MRWDFKPFILIQEKHPNRAGVIIHELCHLCDIEEGADMYAVESAECLKNIILHLNNKITLDAIEAEYARKQDPQERDDDILTYDENQPRVPAGSPEGGQWTDSGGSGSSNAKERFSEYVKASMKNIDFSKIEDELGSLADKIEEEGKALAKKSLEESSKDLDKIIDDTMNEIAENQEIADEETLKEKLKEIGESIVDDFRKNSKAENKAESQSKENEMQAFVDFLSKDDSDGFSDKLEIAKDKLLNNKITDLAKDFKTKSEKNILPKIKDFINYIKSALSKESKDIDSNKDENNEANPKEKAKNINESTSDAFTKNTESEKKSTTGYKNENFTLSSVGTDRTSDKNRVELEDCVKFKDENGNENGTWVGISGSDSNKKYAKGEKYPVLGQVETSLLSFSDINDNDEIIYKQTENTIKNAIVLESVSTENGEIEFSRMPIVKMPKNAKYASNGVNINAIKLKVKLSIPSYEKLKNAIIEKSNWTEGDNFDLNPKKYILEYQGAHKADDPKFNEGNIINYDEIENQLNENNEILYEKSILIDLDGGKVKAID